MTQQLKEITPTESADLLTPLIARVFRFYKTHKKGVWTAVCIVLLAAAVGTAYTLFQQQKTQASWAAFYQANIAFSTEGEAAGLNALTDVATRYPGAPAGQYALLLKGDLLYAGEHFTQAADVYKQLLSSTNETVRTVAALSLAAAQQGAQDYTSAIQTAQDFITNNPKSFALAQAYFTLAMSQELAGHKTEALNAYKYLLENYAQTYFGLFAKDKINQLNK